MDILSFQINEIREARPDPDEEERLLREEKILAHAEKLKELVAGAYNEIYRAMSAAPCQPCSTPWLLHRAGWRRRRRLIRS